MRRTVSRDIIQTTASTRMKLVTDADKSRLVPDHGDEFIGKLLLADALGATDLDFSDGLFQAAKRKARGYTRFQTMGIVLFLIAGKLNFSAINPYAA